MIWRTHYQTRVELEAHCPASRFVSVGQIAEGAKADPTSPVWIGGFGLKAYAQQQVWLRLMSSAFAEGSFELLFIAEKWTVPERDQARTLLPQSMHPLSWLVVDPAQEWRKIIDPDEEDRGFALVKSSDGTIETLMIGPPTEDAWEAFEMIARRSLLG